jgi:hypothetical protein
MNVAKTERVSPEEFSMLDDSIWMVLNSMRSRCSRLQGQFVSIQFNRNRSHFLRSNLPASECQQERETGENILRASK